MKTIITLIFFIYSAALFACPDLSGTWTAKIVDEYIPKIYPIKISSFTNSILVSYHQPVAFTESYIVDGQEHAGDRVNTGSSYVAKCDANSLTTTRYGLLFKPLINRFSLQDGYLYLEETLGEKKRIYRYERN